MLAEVRSAAKGPDSCQNYDHMQFPAADRTMPIRPRLMGLDITRRMRHNPHLAIFLMPNADLDMATRCDQLQLSHSYLTLGLPLPDSAQHSRFGPAIDPVSLLS